MTIVTIVLAGMALGFQESDDDPPPPPVASPDVDRGGDVDYEAERIDDRELRELIDSARRRFRDTTIPPHDRARYALDVADRIDSAARAEPDAFRRANRWDQAVALLDAFLEGEPDNPLAWSIRLQASVFRWAEGRTWTTRLDRAPGDSEARAEAIDALDDALDRLRSLWILTSRLPGGDLLAQNIRFRYAQTLADRANLEDDPATALDFRQQALGRLHELPPEPPLGGHAALLRTRLLVLSDRLRDAEEAFKEARDQPGTSDLDRIDTELSLLVARKEFDQALALIEKAELDRPSKDLRAVRVRARQRSELFPGPGRAEVDADTVTRVRRLKTAGHPDANTALAVLSLAILEPDDPKDLDLWELLAEGHLARGDVARAVQLNQAGADRAEWNDDPERAWLMRYRAGALLVRSGQTRAAAEALQPVAELARRPDSPAASDQNAGASLLHALALGRLASESGGNPSARSAYEADLEAHIAAFPNDPTASEARWILGQLRASAGKDRDAIALWTDIPTDHPRRKEARLAAIDAHRLAIESLASADRTSEARARLAEARADLQRAFNEATELTDRNAIDLARAELELVPGVGDPTEALDRLEHLVSTEIVSERRDRARRLRIIAQAGAGRLADAESNARAELEQSDAEAIVSLAERLDQIGSTLNDQARRRVATLSRLLTERTLARSNELEPGLRARARLIRIRGQIDSGDLDGARRSAESWSTDLDPTKLPPVLIGPLAEALDRLGLFHQSAAAHRAVIARNPAGSRRWLDSRYGLAVSYYRTGRPADARRLIDATLALHPELGGDDDLLDKFQRLRRRLDDAP